MTSKFTGNKTDPAQCQSGRKPLRKGEVSSKSGPSDSPYTKLKEITDHFRSHILCISAVVWHLFPKLGCVNTTELKTMKTKHMHN